MISIGRRTVPEFDYRLWTWVQASGLDVSPVETTTQIIARLDDDRLQALSSHVEKQLRGNQYAQEI